MAPERRGADMLAGKTVLVTGAGGGVGTGIALACGRAGANVVVTARRETADEVAARITEQGGTALAVRCDVTDRAQLTGAVDRAVEAFGGLDAFIHNATARASSQPHLLEEATLDLYEEHSSVSLRGSYLCAQVAHHALAERGGSLVLLTSPAGIEGADERPLYGVVKAGQRAMTKSLALEWGADGIRVNAIAPLAVSEALDRAFEVDPALQARLEALVPLGWIGLPEPDIGYVAAFLASDWARYVTGQTYIVSGGRFTLL